MHVCVCVCVCIYIYIYIYIYIFTHLCIQKTFIKLKSDLLDLCNVNVHGLIGV